jgi:hypothetical protein
MLILFHLKAETIRQMEGEQHETMQLNMIKKLAARIPNMILIARGVA